MTFTAIAHRNAAAIHALQRGENMRAVVRFRRTLSDVHQKCHERDYHAAQRSQETLRRPQHQEIEQKDIVKTVPLPPLKESPSCTADPIYNNAFEIPQGDETTSMECISTILLFNISVALHRDAIMNNQSESMQRAMFMYRQAHSCVEKVNLMDHPGLISVLAAIYFNMAQLHATLFQVKECRYLRDRLRQLFEWGGATLMGESDYAFYHFHMWVAWVDNFRLAPAA